MAQDTTRLVIIVIALQLIVAMAVTFDNSPTALSYDQLDNTINNLEASRSDADKETIVLKPDNLQEETSVGSTSTMSDNIWQILRNGLIPLPFLLTAYTTDVVLTTVVYTLSFIWGLLWIIIIIEAFKLFKNKKT